MKRRRTRATLETAVDHASSPRNKAIALYQLALFHDNNSRESEAIALYEESLASGLPPNLKAHARAWLASSLQKTGSPKRALAQLCRAREITRNRDLLKFLDGLEARIKRAPRDS